MRISYNGVEFQQVLLEDLKMSAEKDPTGFDVTMTRIELTITFQWNPFATASIPQGSRLLNGPGPFPNDSIGLSVRNLREQLNAPRKLLKIAFGPDETFQCPESDGNGQRPCDPGYGPQPEVLSLAEVVGEKNGLGKWRVTFWVTGTSNILLSNRWTVKVETNSAGMSRRIIDGGRSAGRITRRQTLEQFSGREARAPAGLPGLMISAVTSFVPCRAAIIARQ